MTTFIPVDPQQAAGKVKALLNAVHAKMGMTPNMTRNMARSPAVLEGYLALAGALAGGTLDAKLRERIALVTAQANGCEYCLSAHTLLGKAAGLTAAEMNAARIADAADARGQAALKFASTLLATHGNPGDADIASLRAAGFADGDIGEIIANVALNVLTNYFNNVTRPVVDFPVVRATPVAQAA